jgi:two-component system, response regulator YesN
MGEIMKKSSFFRKLFTFLTIILILPIVFTYLISNYTTLKNSEKQIINDNAEKLKSAEDTLEQLEKNIIKESFRLSINSSINKLNNINAKINLSDSKDIETASRVLDTLSDLVTVNSEYQSIYLYLDDFGYAFTSNNGLVKKDLLKDTQWLEYYNKHKNNKTLMAVPKSADDRVLTYIYPLTFSINLKGTFVINVKQDMISSIINNSNYNAENYIFVINDSGEFITYPNTKFFPKDVLMDNYIREIIKNPLSKGLIISTLEKNKYITCYLKSSLNDWIFVSVSPISVLSNKVSEIRTNKNYRVIFAFLVCIFAAFLISKIAANQFERILNIKKDENSIFYRLLSILTRKEKVLVSVEEDIKINNKNNLLISILKDNILDEVDKKIIEEKFKYNSYICAVISIDRYENFTKLDSERQRYLKDLIDKLFSEAIKVNVLCDNLEWRGNELIFIINIDKSKLGITNQYDSLKSIFTNVKEELVQSLENSISIGVGMSHDGINGIKDSYFEAQIALKQKLKLGFGSIILWDEKFIVNNYYYPLKFEERLLDNLRSQPEENIQMILDDLIKDLINRDNLNSSNIFQVFNQLIGNTVIKYLLEKNIDIHDIFHANFDIYYELSTRETIQEIKDWLLDVYLRVKEYYDGVRCSTKKNLDSIIEYIANNYKRDIGINDISDAVGLSYSHVRKIFKDELGENIMDYINIMRIKDAKLLLINTDLSIKNIAVNLGYNNDQSFTRFFKKYKGMTPGEYRNIEKYTTIHSKKGL